MVYGFLTPLRTETLAARRWLLTDDLVYRSMYYHTPYDSGVFIIPRGYQTDLASIPRILWSIFPPVDDYDPQAVLHDASYGNALQTEHGDRVFMIKSLCDQLFLESLRTSSPTVGYRSIHPIRARLMYQAVHRWGNPDGHPLAKHRIQCEPGMRFLSTTTT
jgi:hypothetical protein